MNDPSLIPIDGAGDIRRTIPPRAEREALGKEMRQRVPRSVHGRWRAAPDRPDPVDVIRARNRGRQQRLVPIRIGRMVASPFAFYRGSADLMAIDLRPSPATGLVVQLCGDAHLSNFGLYASPERRLVMDINDFDETAPRALGVGPEATGRQRRALRAGQRARRGPADRGGG